MTKKLDCVFRRVPECKENTTHRAASCCCDCGKRKTCKRVCGYLTAKGCCELGKQVEADKERV